MYFTYDALLPENQDPLIITAAPIGPVWIPGDDPHLPVTWDEQVQAAVDCYNAGATMLHIHVRDPQSGHISKNFKQYGEQIGRLRAAVPKMVLQVGGSISFSPEGDEAAHWQSYDTRHMLAEIDPKPDQVTVAIGSSLWDITSHMTMDDVQGTHIANAEAMWQFSNMVADSTPAFYIEHLKRLRAHGIQPYFALAHVHQLEIVERLIRDGLYMGPVNGFFSMVGGGVTGANPYDWMELIRRTPQGSVWTYQTTMRYMWPLASMCIALGQHTRAGIEENFWGPHKGERLTSVQQVEKQVRMARELGREIATAEDARRILKIGTWYNSVEETLFNLGLPPNRGTRLGFLTYETDGRLPDPAAVPASPVDPRHVL